MSLEDHLDPGEQIISRCHPFYATSKRVLRYGKKGQMEQVEHLPYARLSSVELVERPSHKVMVTGTLIAILGVVLATMGLVTSILALVAGVALVAYGGIGRPGYYQFRAHNMSKAEEGRWRMDHRVAPAFIATIRTIIGERRGL
ncbi:MAG: hypothetical protein HYY00_08905 [Chloroflexi bacterium]|nr:hypothetical protein [Chloroflexota bacterium]